MDPSKATAIITEEKQNKLLKIILAADNTFAPMGSGGYEIKNKGIIKRKKSNVIVVYFTECDCAPARTFAAFIDGQTIYARNVDKVIMGLLSRSRISFSAKPDSEVPEYIKAYIIKEFGK